MMALKVIANPAEDVVCCGSSTPVAAASALQWWRLVSPLR